MDDRAVVAAMVAGDPRGLEHAYHRYAPRLHAYCRSLLRDADLAADVVQDTFLIAGQRAAQLRAPERLLAWLYAIARHECLRQARARRREAAAEFDEPSTDPDLARDVQTAHVRQLVHAAIDGLAARDREILHLALRHELRPDDLGAVLGLPANHVHARLSRARAALERSLGVLLVARSATCPPLRALLVGWNGRLDPLLRKRLSRHIDDCDRCRATRGALLSPSALIGAYTAGPFAVVVTVRDRPAPDAPELDRATGFPVRRRHRRGGMTVAAAAAVVIALALLLSRPAPPPVESAVADSRTPPVAARSPAPTPSTTESPATAADEAEPRLLPPPATGPPPRPASPAASLDSPGPSVPFAVAATARVACSAGARSYRLTVFVDATRQLASATLVLRGPATTPTRTALVHAGTTARGERPALRYTTEWWVAVRAADGAAARTAQHTVTDPCPSPTSGVRRGRSG
ncbi:RNA polymerase sigma factor [Asanoa sp. WMMD1127]|uniref:RNA polymerase sigma factor n=1 Tax=Asanoa sp. WMMD1127 TaxID=3016107 RepID=UPI002416F162|nr:RNA polymerase sigma factor [Asanoa sp. WMMD1127]MDG4824949.1 RNA polymerase sigma factor [Asanoa sp. WMMD1127]